MMAERPETRRYRGIPSWDDEVPRDDPDVSGSADRDRSPGSETPPERWDRDPPASGPGGAPRGSSAGAAPGLYDLPGLLARIWSVPAARLATSGSYTSTPPVRYPEPPPQFADRQPSLPTPPSDPWSQLTRREVPSIASAAVLPLSLIPAFRDPLAPRPSRRGRRAADPVEFLPSQYPSWKHPPCRAAVDPRPPIGAPRCLKGVLEATAVPPEVTVTWDLPPSRRAPLILPASLPRPRGAAAGWVAPEPLPDPRGPSHAPADTARPSRPAPPSP